MERTIGAETQAVVTRSTQATTAGKHTEHRNHPGAERRLLRPPQRIGAAAQDWRREIEADLEIAVELFAQLLFEPAVGVEPRHLVLVLVGEQFGIVDRDSARQLLAKA